MLCCVGLFGGFAVGQALGGPWTVIAPAAGFGIGLVADMKMMRGHQKAGAQQAGTELRAKAHADPNAPKQGAEAAPAAESAACCGVASGVARMLRMKERETGSGEPPARGQAAETATAAQPAAVEKAKSA